MRIPKIKGVIRRRILVNFRAFPDVVQRIIPTPFRPKLHEGHAIVGTCLIRLEQIRPAGFPAVCGVSSENAAHRIAVEWTDHDGLLREGVYIPRRDSGSWLNQLAGGRIFPGHHHSASFSVRDRDSQIELLMRSADRLVSIKIVGSDADALPLASCFKSLNEASDFFEKGSLGYSASRDPKRSDGLVLRTKNWQVRALELSDVDSSYFKDERTFPAGCVHFDHALVMRDIEHEWHWTEDMLHDGKINGRSGVH
jgi:hypothetical protein